MFSKLLVANRGEIACRVIRTARRMGIATVAVYSEADAQALHVQQADEAVCIGRAPSAESYLRIEAILEACRATGAEAVHPGYGFLSENPAFVAALEEARVTFVGPGRAAITTMGDKIASKRIAEGAGVNVIPGHAGVVNDGGHAVEIARSIGYPVMLKASAGGGGKGMRIARDDGQTREGFERATSEARSAFGDDRIFVEKFIEEPRHVEIQVFADAHGNAIHLGERECSIQRRHQKIIEESPSPFVDEEMRAAMGAQALALARAVGYRSAGTVEFVVDAERGFYFLEMNTRLQVEHPVTELVTGLDLVELMIRVAAGEPLALVQADVGWHGWAIEARVYAEDPTRGFLPSAGRLTRLSTPPESRWVRIDTGVAEGADVPVFYDPMIAKLVVRAETRACAVDRLRAALDRFHVRGVAENTGFLGAVARLPRFEQGALTTHLVDEEFPTGYDPEHVPPEDRALLVSVAVVVHARNTRRERLIEGRVREEPARRDEDWVVTRHAERWPARVRAEQGGLEVVEHDGRAIEVESAWRPGLALFEGLVDGRDVCVQVDRDGVRWRLRHGGWWASVLVVTPRAADLLAHVPERAPSDAERYLVAPMPGLLVSLSVAAGDEVKAGQEIAVIEAMKMENVLRADADRTVAAVHAAPGDGLAADQAIVEFE